MCDRAKQSVQTTEKNMVWNAMTNKIDLGSQWVYSQVSKVMRMVVGCHERLALVLGRLFHV